MIALFNKMVFAFMLYLSLSLTLLACEIGTTDSVLLYSATYLANHGLNFSYVVLEPFTTIVIFFVAMAVTFIVYS